MTLSPTQCQAAGRLQRQGLTLREIAAELGVSREAVTLYLFGGIADWNGPRIGSQAEPDPEARGDGNAPGPQDGGFAADPLFRAMAADDIVRMPVDSDPHRSASPPPAPASGRGGEAAPPLWYPPGTPQSGLPALLPDAGGRGAEGEAELGDLPPPDEDERAQDEAELAMLDAVAEGEARSGATEGLDGECVVDETAPPSEGGRGGQASPQGSASPHGGSATAPPLQRSSGAGARPVAVAEGEARSGANGSRDSLQAEPADSRPAGEPPLYILRSPDGQFLHRGEHTLTRLPAFYWEGTAPEYERLFRRRPEWRELEPVRIPAPRAPLRASPSATAAGTPSRLPGRH